MAFSLQGWTVPCGYLKISHVILGAISVGLIGYYSSFKDYVLLTSEILYFMLVSCSCLFTSFILLLAYLDENTAKNVGSSIFEIYYHALSGIFCVSATGALTIIASKSDPYAAYIVAINCAALNSGLYFLNASKAFKSQ